MLGWQRPIPRRPPGSGLGPPCPTLAPASLPVVSYRPTIRELAVALALRGNFTYGGGSATIGTLHEEIVQKRGWLTEEPFQLS